MVQSVGSDEHIEESELGSELYIESSLTLILDPPVVDGRPRLPPHNVITRPAFTAAPFEEAKLVWSSS